MEYHWIDPECDRPVSYTHLDVYKRQEYGNEYLYVDEDMRLRLETKLIHSIVTSFKVLPV